MPDDPGGYGEAAAQPAVSDPDKPCLHENFDARVAIGRLLASEGDTEPNAFTADITVHCTGCGERFRWIGAPAGLNGGHPTVSVDEFTLHAPLRPASSDPDFGLGIPGFSIRMQMGNDA